MADGITSGLLDRKASELDEASELDGEEFWAGVQGGVDCRIKTSQLTSHIADVVKSDPDIGAEGARPYAEAAELSAGQALAAKSVSQTQADRSKDEADRASAQADRSELAATAALTEVLYLDVEEGRLATAEGEVFYVQAQGDDELALLYRVIDGLAVFTGKVVPSATLVLAGVEAVSEAGATQIVAPPPSPDILMVKIDRRGGAIIHYDFARQGYVIQMVGDEDQSFANARLLNVPQTDPNKLIFQVDKGGIATDYWDLKQQGRVIQMPGDEVAQEANARLIVVPPLADGKVPATVDYQGKLLTYRDIDGVEKPWAPSAATEILPPFVVEVAADIINFYFQQGGPSSTVYTKRPFVHAVDASRNADVWHLWEGYEATLTGAETFATGQQILLAGEVEMAIYIPGRADDHIGGVLHGNQKKTDVYMKMNGARFDHMNPVNYGFYRPDIFEVYQSSDVFLIGATLETKWDPTNPKMAGQWTCWTFGGPDDVNVRPVTKFEESTLSTYSFDHAYFGMGPIIRAIGAVQVSDRGAFGPRGFPVRDMTNSGFESFSTWTGDGAQPGADSAMVWGDRYACGFKALRGWSDANCRIYISRTSLNPYNKIYPSFNRTSAAAGDIWDFEFSLPLSINTGA